MDVFALPGTNSLSASDQHFLGFGSAAFIVFSMCGRFTSLTPPEELAQLFAADIVDEVPDVTFQKNFNVAPSTRIFAVASTSAQGRRLGRLKWGLVPEWSKDGAGTGHINARSETVAQKPSFRDSFAKRRCIIPMSGYYEWRTVHEGEAPGGPKRAVYVSRADGQPLAVAGLWSTWTDRRSVSVPSDDVTGETTAKSLKTCCVITREANAMLATVHDRMPVILEERYWSAWLGERDHKGIPLEEILRSDGSGSDLSMIEVGSKVNNIRNNGSDLIAPE